MNRKPRAADASSLALLLGAVLLGGCFESKAEIRILADGTGTVRQAWSLDARAHDALVRRAAELLTGRPAPPVLPAAAPLASAWWRRAARGVEGYTIDRLESRVEGARHAAEAEGRFETAGAAARAGAFLTAGLSLERAKEGWRLTVEDAWAPIARDPAGEVAGRPYAEVVDALAPWLERLRLERTFVLPSEVVSTSGTLLPDGRSVRWVVTGADLGNADALRLTIVFADRPALALRPFRHRPDVDGLVQRFLEAPPGAR